MKRIATIIAILITSLYSYAGVSWSDNLPSMICYGSPVGYYVKAYCGDDIGQFKGISFVMKKQNNSGVWVNEDESVVENVYLGAYPTSGTSNTVEVSFAFKKELIIGTKYRLDVTAYKGVGKKPHGYSVEFEIYDAASERIIETDDIFYTDGKLVVCPYNENEYEFYIDGFINSNIKWTAVTSDVTVKYPDSLKLSNTFSFDPTEGNYWEIKAETQGGCYLQKKQKVYPIKKQYIGDAIQIDGGDAICKEGKENYVSIPAQSWAESYEWSVTEGASLIEITPDGNRCKIEVDEDAINDETFIIKVIVHSENDCFNVPITREFEISDIIADADYIDLNSQNTNDFKICYNSTDIPIIGPTSATTSNIILWQWSDGTTKQTLNKTFTTDQTISVLVTDSRECQRTYTFDVDVQEPPTLSLPWEQICEEQEINIDLSGEIGSYPITWSDGNTSSIRSFVNPNYSFDEIFTLQYHEFNGNVCTKNYTQHFEINEIPTFEAEPDFTCIGDNISLLAPLGYTYLWEDITSSKSSTARYFNINDIDQTHQVDLTVSTNGCNFSKTYTVGVKEQPELFLEGGNDYQVCFGSDLELSVPLDFKNVTWSHDGSSSNTATLTNIRADQSILVTAEKNNCYVEAYVTIEVLPVPSISLETDEDSYCGGESFTISLTGDIDGTTIDETLLKSIDWSHGIDYRMSNKLDLDETTEISVSVEDYNGCQATTYKTITIDENPELTMANQYVCEGKDLSINTGSPYSKYLWYNGSTGSSINLSDVQASVTNAWVKVTDDNGCETTSEFEIQMFDVDQIYYEPIDICKGQSTTLTAPSGFLSYFWNNGETTRSITVSPSDDFTYSCVVSEGDCEQTIEFEVNVGESTSFTLDNVFACKGANTTITGPDGYDAYAWNYMAAQTQSLIFTTNMDFTLQLTAWKDGCPHTASAQVVVEEAESFSLNDKAICEGSSISYTAPGGYSYDWSDDSQDGKQTGTFSPTATTTYQLTIEDAYGCTSTDEFTVTVNDFIDFNVPDREICRGTTTEISVFPIYTSYLWSTGETTNSISVSPLSDASYSVTVTDFNGCEGTAYSEVTVLDNLSLALENKQICEGDFVTIGIDDSQTDYYSYAWSNGSNQSQQDVSPATTTSYSLTVEDENGCSATASMQVTVFTPQSISIDQQTVCQGDEVQLVAPSGLTDHTWNGEETGLDAYTLSDLQYNTIVNYQARDAHGCMTYATTDVLVNRTPLLNMSDQYMCKFQTIQLNVPDIYQSINWSNGSTQSSTDILALEDAAMFVTVEDVNGCTTTANFDLAVYDYTPLSLSNQTICKGEDVTITLPGTWASQIWSNGKTSSEITEEPVRTTDYFVQAIDLNGCKSTASMMVMVNEPYKYELPSIEMCAGESTTITADPGFTSYLWQTGETSQSIDFTAEKNELVTLAYTDANGCAGTAKKLAIIYLKPEIYLDDYNVCNGNSVDLKAPGGFSYQWNNGSIDRINTVSPHTNTTYTLIATDGYGCRDTASTTVTVRSNPMVTLPGTAICPGETVNLDGGSGYNHYYWSNGVTGRYNTVTPTSDTYLNLTVEDVYGCEGKATASIIVQSVTDLSLSSISACIGDTVSINAQSGFATYEWTTGATTRALRDVLSNYDKIGLTVVDNHGCEQYEEQTVNVLEKPDYFLSEEYVACDGASVDVNITPGYLRYLWSDGSYLNNRTFWPTSSTDYTLTVEHVNGCKLTKETTVRNSSFVNNYLNDQLACHEENVLYELYNSENLININWSTGATGNSSIYVQATQDSIISVTFDDLYGCSGSASGQLFLQASVSPNIPDRTICKGQTTTLYAGGVYSSYKWSTGATTPTITITPDKTRTISLEVEDSYGCRYTSSSTITVKDMPEFTLNDLVLCYTDTITVGVPKMEGYSYQWNTGDTTNFISKFVNTDKTYILTLRDRENGCTIKDTININVYPEPEEFNIPNQFADKGDVLILSVDGAYKNVQWSTGETTNTIAYKADTNEYLYVEAVDENSCRVREEVYIYVAGPEEFMVESDSVCSGNPCVIQARSGYKEYLWSTGSTADYIVTYDNDSKEYTVSITDYEGATNSFTTKSNIIPGPEITVGDTTICYGSDLTFRLPAGQKRYQWTTGETSNEVTYSDLVEAFSFGVLVESANGCVSEKTGYIDFHTDNFTLLGLKDSYKVGEQIDISLSNPDDIESCIININGVEYTDVEALAKIFNESEVLVSYSLQDKNGCYFEDSKTITITGKTSLESLSHDNSIFIYPNPVKDKLNIEVSNYQEGYTITLYAVNGQLITCEHIFDKTYQMNTGNLKPGVYMLKIITEDQTVIRNIVKN